MNYFKIHKNKKPKKARYSKPYSKLEYGKMDELIEHFREQIKQLNNGKIN